MIKRFQTLGIVALVAVSALALASQGLTIKRTPKEGQVTRYKMTGSIALPDPIGTVNVRGIVEEKITKVEADGTYTTVQTQVEAFASRGTDAEQAVDNQSATTTKYNAKGEVVSIEVDTDPVAAWRMAGLNLFIEPGKPVNIGDKWSHEIKADEKTGAVAAKADYTVLGEEKVGSVDTIKIKCTVSETAGDQPASSDVTVWIDKKDSTMVQAETKVKQAPFATPAGTFALDGTLKMTRIEG
ncbi:MAG TPA: hypothetical protein VK934_01155 [Fimbriimonas sp.]|nr:hypothetical protein [Fimbriimonas sp.]